DDDREKAEIRLPENEERVQRHAGDDPRQRNRKYEEERDRLPAEESEAVHRERRGRAENQGDRRRPEAGFEREPERLSHLRGVERRTEPFGGLVGDRPALRGVGVTRVREDDCYRRV